MGRLPDVAWNRSQEDRVFLSVLYTDRTGLELSQAEMDEQFRIGAATSEPILEHARARNAIDQLVEALCDAEDDGKERITGHQILSITGLGAPSAAAAG